MLVMPFICGLSVAGVSAYHALLFSAWLVLYLFSFPLLLWIKTGKTSRYRKPTWIYGILLLPLLAAVVYVWPLLFIYGIVLVLFFIPNIYYARTRNERALLNDLIAIFMFCSFVYPTAYVGGQINWMDIHILFCALVLYFAGTALYVKTMIRERKNPVYYYVSVGYHLLLLGLAVWWNPWLALPALILLIRSLGLPHFNLKIKAVGITEIGCAVIVCLFIITV